MARAWILCGLLVGACNFPQPPDVPDDDDDSVALAVVSAQPAPHAASVAPTTSIQVTFSQPIDVRSGPRFAIAAAGADIPGTVAVDGAVLSFRPTSPLPAGTPVTVVVDNVATAAGDTLAAPYAFDFTTKTTLCVKVGGGDGCFALPSLAVQQATANDSIAIAAGDYVDNIELNRTITLLGGFDAAFATRDPATLISVIRPKEPPDMNRSILLVNLGGGSALVDGLTLTDGNSGGEHGGGLRIEQSTARIQNCRIANNRSSFTGGGVYITFDSNVQLIANRIENNTMLNGGSGGGLTVESSTVVLRNNIITGNKTLVDGTAGNQTGGAGGVYLTDTIATLENNRIDGNRSENVGMLGGGGGMLLSGSHTTITGGSISSNEIATAGKGGAVMVQQGVLRLDGVRISGNTVPAQAAGGANGIQVVGGAVIVASTIVASNTGGIGAIALVPDTTGSAPVAGSLVVLNSTIADNSETGVVASSPLTIVNSAIVRQPVGIAVTAAPPVLVKNNALFSNTTNSSGVTLDASNLVVDPRFDDKLHLMAGSPLIDAGQAGMIQTAVANAPAVAPPSFDIDGNVRSLGARPDIGADEFVPAP